MRQTLFQLCWWLVLGLLSGNAQASLTNGLIHYWPMDSIRDGATPDLVSGHDLQAHKLDASSLQDGRHRKAIALNGYNQYLHRVNSDSASIPITQQREYTVAFWVRGVPGQSNRMVFAQSSTRSIAPLFLLGTHRWGTNNALNVCYRTLKGNSTLDNKPTHTEIFDDCWHHIAWTCSNQVGQVYVDGLPDPEDFTHARATMPMDCLSVGALLRAPPIYFFEGAVDELALWKRVLSPEEIQEALNDQLSETRFPQR